MAERQVRVREEKAVNVVRVRLLRRAAKEKKPSPLKAVATSTTTKAANRILIAKMQTVKPLQLAGRSVQEVIVPMAEGGIVEVVAAGIAEVAVVALEAAAIVVLAVVAVEIAAIASLSSSK